MYHKTFYLHVLATLYVETHHLPMIVLHIPALMVPLAWIYCFVFLHNSGPRRGTYEAGIEGPQIEPSCSFARGQWHEALAHLLLRNQARKPVSANQ